SADTEGPKCDLPWEKLHRTCVQFMKAKPFLTWQKARDSCISMNADILSVNDKEENRKLKPLVRRHVRSRDLLYWWIGIREVGHSWLWVDNDEQYANIPEWAAGQGRFHTGRCGLYSFRGTLENVECELEKPYICEQFKVTTDSTTLTTTGKATSASTDKQTPNPTRGSYTTIAISKEPLTDRITGILTKFIFLSLHINAGKVKISHLLAYINKSDTVLLSCQSTIDRNI
ncbi:oxidized low-density lipoprotein receptor 1-like, partial [Ruditapes philippinarum]|uniref:oxidized low-density lipoprotein receptor 1-like n=1 Tax=Ruditapes philippinarum TaxID=129788 RepID=UPI00295B3A66